MKRAVVLHLCAAVAMFVVGGFVNKYVDTTAGSGICTLAGLLGGMLLRQPGYAKKSDDAG